MQVGAGAADENGIEEIGTAHMVEHMVSGVRRFPTVWGMRWLQRDGGAARSFNALTGHERTLYLFRSDKGRAGLEQAFQALSAMMSPHVFSAETGVRKSRLSKPNGVTGWARQGG